MEDSGSYEKGGDEIVNDLHKKAFILLGERNILKQEIGPLEKDKKRLEARLNRTRRRIQAISLEIQELMHEGDMGDG